MSKTIQRVKSPRAAEMTLTAERIFDTLSPTDKKKIEARCAKRSCVRSCLLPITSS